MKKCVLVTGSSGNIGCEIIKKFASQNYSVVICYNNNYDEAIKLKKEIIKKYNADVIAIRCNISSESEVENMVEKIISKFGRIDILVNNAAIEVNIDFFDKNYDSFKKVFDVNVIGTFLVTKHVAKNMLKEKKGNIINISSNNAIDKYDPNTLEYDASKAAIINMTHNFAREFAPFINVNSILPGWVETNKIKELDNELDNKFISSESEKILLGRFAKESEIANVVFFLASEEASYINDSIIRVDGGSR
ncbi:MAG: SDR family NAD(P)-dependent oxidoreductase [bacterium]|nr:SDR family NAD(P)-dependent oxidoreductase [bacterium]